MLRWNGCIITLFEALTSYIGTTSAAVVLSEGEGESLWCHQSTSLCYPPIIRQEVALRFILGSEHSKEGQSSPSDNMPRRKTSSGTSSKSKAASSRSGSRSARTGAGAGASSAGAARSSAAVAALFKVYAGEGDYIGVGVFGAAGWCLSPLYVGNTCCLLPLHGRWYR
jgi:hypothetical protein